MNSMTGALRTRSDEPRESLIGEDSWRLPGLAMHTALAAALAAGRENVGNLRNSYSLVVGFLLSVGLLGHAELGFGQTNPDRNTESGLSITVRLHDYVRVKRHILAKAEGQATRILRKAGICAAWVDCPLTASELDQYHVCLASSESPHLT